MSNSTSLSEEASASSGTKVQDLGCLNNMFSDVSPLQPQKIKKKRNLPGNPDPDSEVIALSPRTLLATNRFICEICNKGFQRDQNLQLHRRGHNLPWKLRQRNSKEVMRKKVYVCPEPSCVHHHPSRALGDLTGVKKHFCRKHGEKKWKCEKCSKRYAVQSDYKAHSKTCGTREYKCDCGTIFSRKDSFITHRAFCDALAQESARLSSTQLTSTNPLPDHSLHLHHPQQNPISSSSSSSTTSSSSSSSSSLFPFSTHQQQHNFLNPHTNISLTSWDPTHQNPSINNPSQNTIQIIKPELLHPHVSAVPSNISYSLSFFQPPPPTSHNKPSFMNISIPSFLHHHQAHHNHMDNSNSLMNTGAAHLSATALLEKAANVGSAAALTGSASQTRSVGHMASSSSMTSQLDMMSISHHQDYPGFSSGHLATWQKSDRLTRDFLGLTGDQCNNVRDLLSIPGSSAVNFPSYDHDHSILKPSAFGFGESNWGEIAEGGQNVIS